jgi:hypothetical protein
MEMLMRIAICCVAFTLVIAGAGGVGVLCCAQERQDVNRKVVGGGIEAKGWLGKIDDSAAKAGQTVNDARLVEVGDALHVTTGPAVTYWSPQNMANGDYTVSATFTEPKFQNLNSHPHPYGIAIAGNNLGTAHESFLYCAAYGNGKFIVRGFGPDAFKMNGREGAASPAVHKAAAIGEPVTQDISMSVKGDKVSCSINGTTVAMYDKATLVAPGKLKATDGLYGVRFAHNTDAIVTNLKMTKP